MKSSTTTGSGCSYFYFPLMPTFLLLLNYFYPHSEVTSAYWIRQEVEIKGRYNNNKSRLKRTFRIS